MKSARAHLSEPRRPGVFHIANYCVQGLNLLEKPQYKAIFLELLARAQRSFTLEIFGFSLKEEAFHLQIRTQPEAQAQLSPRDVACRWLQFSPVKKRKAKRQASNPAEKKDAGPGKPEPAVDTPELPAPCEPTEQQIQNLLEKFSKTPQYLKTLQDRLGSPSWMMRLVQQRFSRQINLLNGRRGTCWQGPYQSTELLNPSVTLAAMLFVDLSASEEATVLSPTIHSGASQRAAALSPIVPEPAEEPSVPQPPEEKPSKIPIYKRVYGRIANFFSSLFRPETACDDKVITVPAAGDPLEASVKDSVRTLPMTLAFRPLALRPIRQCLSPLELDDPLYLSIFTAVAEWKHGGMMGGIPEFQGEMESLGLELEALRRVFSNPKSLVSRTKNIGAKGARKNRNPGRWIDNPTLSRPEPGSP